MITRRRSTLVGALVCGSLAMAGGKPAWGPHDKRPATAKLPAGHNNLLTGDIDFDALSPKDCASYLCVPNIDLATEYIEKGCPGAFSLFTSAEEHDQEEQMPELLVENTLYDGSSGVRTSTLLALAGASGIFAAGVGFVAGYKASPSFAYMRIPSLV